MTSLSVSEFKATCLSVIARVQRSGQTFLITKHGHPVAELVPTRAPRHKGRGFLGRMRAEFDIVGDVMSPVLTAGEWTEGLLGPTSKRRNR